MAVSLQDALATIDKSAMDMFGGISSADFQSLPPYAQFQLQMQAMNERTQLISNTLKTMHDTKMAIINNLK